MGEVIRGNFGRAAVKRPIPLVADIDHAILADHGLQDEFPQDLLLDACAAASRHRDGLAGRTDLLDLPFFTLSAREDEGLHTALVVRSDRAPDNLGGFVLHVAEPDVAWYVLPETPLDREARERGFTVQLAERAVPILPPLLTDNYCSFQPGKDRLAVVKTIRLTADGERLGDLAIDRAVIRSRAALSFAQLDDRLSGGETALSATIGAIEPAYFALHDAAAQRGEMSKDRPKTNVIVTPGGAVQGFETPPREYSRDIAAKITVAMNAACADYLANFSGIDALYRGHDASGMEDSSGKSGFHSMPRAHAGLNLPHYMHAACPVLSYPDMINQRALLDVSGYTTPGAVLSDINPQDLATAMNARKCLIAKAEDEAEQRYALAWLAGRKGESFKVKVLRASPAAIKLAFEDCPYRHTETPDNPFFPLLRGFLERATPETRAAFSLRVEGDTDAGGNSLKLDLKALAVIPASLPPPLQQIS